MSVFTGVLLGLVLGLSGCDQPAVLADFPQRTQSETAAVSDDCLPSGRYENNKGSRILKPSAEGTNTANRVGEGTRGTTTFGTTSRARLETALPSGPRKSSEPEPHDGALDARPTTAKHSGAPFFYCAIKFFTIYPFSNLYSNFL